MIIKITIKITSKLTVTKIITTTAKATIGTIATAVIVIIIMKIYIINEKQNCLQQWSTGTCTANRLYVILNIVIEFIGIKRA